MNLAKLLTKTARTYPDKPALVHGSKMLTFAQFNERANRLANALLGLGVSPGDNVAVLQYNYPETLETIFACFKAGCGAVPINFRLHSKECAYIIDHSQARAVVLSPEFNQPIMDVRREMPDVEHFITLEGTKGDLRDYESLLAAASPELEDAQVEPDQLAWLFYTSGTTGQPKGAMLTHRNLLAMTMNFYADMSPLGPDDAVLHGAPLSHGSGLYALPNIAKGALNVILEGKSFEPELVFKTIERHRITNMFAAPTMVKRLAESPAADKYDHSSLKCLNYGGAPMYVEDLKKAMRTLGPCLVQLYGQGEAPRTITSRPTPDHKLEGTPAQMSRLASAGLPRTDTERAVV
ncbi:MAG: AMP-binding protein, partial [Pseudomonadota bacterium]